MSTIGRKASADLVIKNASQLLTCSGDQPDSIGIIDNGWVAATDGVIVAVGSEEDIMSKVDCFDAQVIDASGKVVAPGFVRSSPRSKARLISVSLLSLSDPASSSYSPAKASPSRVEPIAPVMYIFLFTVLSQRASQASDISFAPNSIAKSAMAVYIYMARTECPKASFCSIGGMWDWE